MKITLNKATIVILAKEFNPSIVTKDWLIREEIVREDAEKFVNIPNFSLFESKTFIITVAPNRFEIVLKISEPVDHRTFDLESLASVAETFVERLPHTPYNTLGINYIWSAEVEDDENISHILKEEFVCNKETFSKLFPEADYYVGSIIYFPHKDFRVKLVIEPRLDTMKHITSNFNYNISISDYKKLIEKIGMMEDNWNNSKTIVNVLFGKK